MPQTDDIDNHIAHVIEMVDMINSGESSDDVELLNELIVESLNSIFEQGSDYLVNTAKIDQALVEDMQIIFENNNGDLFTLNENQTEVFKNFVAALKNQDELKQFIDNMPHATDEQTQSQEQQENQETLNQYVKKMGYADDREILLHEQHQNEQQLKFYNFLQSSYFQTFQTLANTDLHSYGDEILSKINRAIDVYKPDLPTNVHQLVTQMNDSLDQELSDDFDSSLQNSGVVDLNQNENLFGENYRELMSTIEQEKEQVVERILDVDSQLKETRPTHTSQQRQNPKTDSLAKNGVQHIIGKSKALRAEGNRKVETSQNQSKEVAADKKLEADQPDKQILGKS